MYQNNSDHFESFYQGVDSILKSKLFDEQLDEILKSISSIDENVSKQFESYLNTIILNMQTKINKYKKSVYFDNEMVKDIDFQGCTIPFFIDESKNRVILLGISAKN
ncbi:MAG: hypothetical protein JXQ66_04955 [Campylobacterales bacterium]|nr:hypothetical protein [Campylobacterales bacterium]